VIATSGRNLSLVLQITCFPHSGVKSAVRLRVQPSKWYCILINAKLRRLKCSCLIFLIQGLEITKMSM